MTRSMLAAPPIDAERERKVFSLFFSVLFSTAKKGSCFTGYVCEFVGYFSFADITT